MSDHLTALITGAGRGIGAAVAAALRSDGWRVLNPLRGELDLADPRSIQLYLSRLGEQPINGLVLNAGVNSPAQLGALTETEWSRVQQVNCTSAFSIASALCPAMAKRGFGRVVAISSVYAERARTGRAAYSASKAGLQALVRGISVEFGSADVVANCVAPGFVDTELTRANNTPKAISEILTRVPVGRLGDPSEVAALVTYLMSPANRYLTGQTVAIDGGFSCT